MEKHLDILAWSRLVTAKPIVLDVLTTPRSLYEAMRRATAMRNPTVNPDVMSASMQGIHELFCHASKDVVLVKNWAIEARVPKNLLAYCLPGAGCRDRLANAFQRWLDFQYPEIDQRIVTEACEEIRSDECWERRKIEAEEPRITDVCGTPRNSEYFDVLAAFVAERLSESTVTWEGGEEKSLIRQVGGGYRYNGHELVVWPPTEHLRTPSDGSEPKRFFYTEVLTITTSTHPEQRGRGVHVIARSSMRNWGEVDSKQRTSDRQRSMDCFFCSQSTDGDEIPELHTSMGYKATTDNPDRNQWRGTPEYPIQPKWGRNHQGRYDVLKAVLGWQGEPNVIQHNSNGYLASDFLGNGSVAVFHRRWHGGRDRRLPGGTGVPWRDRKDLGNSLDAGMGEIGFERVPPMQRESTRSPAKSVFYEQGSPEERRRALAQALTAQSGVPNLQMIVARSNDSTGDEVLSAISSVLGEPSIGGNRDELRWRNEDLLINLTVVSSGPFDPPVSKERLPKHERDRLRAEQLLAMREHLASIEAPCKARCAIIERAEALMKSREDPHFRGKIAAAKAGILPQGLVARAQEDESRQHSVESAVRDCFRMIGVVPLHPDHRLPAIAAVTTILDPIDDRNKQKMCVATRAFGNVIECAVLSAEGVVEWIPYSDFMLRVLKRTSPNPWFWRGGEDARRIVTKFVEKVIQDCQSHTDRVLLLMDMDGLAQFVPALRNKDLRFDGIRLGTTVVDASSFDNVAVVRHLDNNRKMPQYHPRVGSIDEPITAGPSGCFRWKNNERTLYAVKSMPRTARSSVGATKHSRHSQEREFPDSANRTAAEFDEMCLLTKPGWCKPMEVLVRTARLKGVHVQYPGHTQVPFPLHEARALGRQL